MGMLAAVEAWGTRNHAAEWDTWMARLDRIAQRVVEVPGVRTRVDQPAGLSNRSPVLRILWDSAGLRITGEEAAEDLARRRPRVAVGVGREGASTMIHITPSQMQPGDEEVVAERIFSLLSAQRAPRSAQPEPPAADIGGRWEVDLRFFRGTSRHEMFLEQEGNWVRGTHRSGFSHQEVAGSVEGSRVKLRSRMSRPGDSIPFVFSGELAGDAIQGTVFLGEYLTARFTATRAPGDFARESFAVPTGPPLAT